MHHLVQREGRFGHDKVNEADVLLWDELDAFDDPASDCVADVFARCVGVQVAHYVADDKRVQTSVMSRINANDIRNRDSQ
jgi:hypothetical protein